MLILRSEKLKNRLDCFIWLVRCWLFGGWIGVLYNRMLVGCWCMVNSNRFGIWGWLLCLIFLKVLFMIILKNVMLCCGIKMLLDKIFVIINFGEKVGFVGCNGVGKLIFFGLFNGMLYEDGGDYLIFS